MKNSFLPVVVSLAIGLFTTSAMAAPVRTVMGHTVISRGDPVVQITLPSAAQYVGRERFLLSKPTLGNTEHCELFAFVDSDSDHRVVKYWWVQFEGYLPSQPNLHMTYDSPRHAKIGGLDFYVDAGVASPAKPPKPGSDGAHFISLLASHGYRRGDLMWVRLVHLIDATKRKELMIIYAESLKPTTYSAAQLGEGGADHAKWADIEGPLIRRAEQSIDIGSQSSSHWTAKGNPPTK